MVFIGGGGASAALKAMLADNVRKIATDKRRMTIPLMDFALDGRPERSFDQIPCRPGKKQRILSGSAPISILRAG
jgi:hypothetical protein